MDSNVAERVSANSYDQGNFYFGKGNFGRAFAHYLVATKLNPGLKTHLKSKFSISLGNWGVELEGKGRFNDLFNCYEQAIEVFPENEQIFNQLGLILLRCGSPKEASIYFRKYLALDSLDLRVLRNLENACNLAVERWHFRMLNDQVRNLAFREAIVKKVKRGFRNVLDIGTGTGILSFFSVEGGANDVYACDDSSTMTSIASQVLEHHEVTSVKLINKHSTKLVIPDDLELRVSMVVCEIVDCGLLGEHVLETLIHAWEHLLEPNGVVLPFGATLHLCGLQSQDISQSSILRTEPLHGLGFDKYRVVANVESYDTEKITMLPKGYKILTEVISPVTIYFNDLHQMKEVLAGSADQIIQLNCNESGTIDCVAGWFTLRVDEDIALQTGPESSITCWEQAIFPSLKTITVQPGEQTEYKLSLKEGKLSLQHCKQDLEETHVVSQSIIKMLNNTGYINVLQNAAKTLSSGRSNSTRILDVSAFPVFGLYFLKRLRPGDQLVCSYSSRNDEKLIRLIAQGLEVERQILCLTNGTIDELIEQKQKFDIILLPLVENSGELNAHYLSRICSVRECLNPGGLLLPQKLAVMGKFVESDWLGGVTKVLNSDVTCGYDVAPFINMFSVEHQIDFRMDSINAISRTKPFCLLSLNPQDCNNDIEQENMIAVDIPGPVNALIYWFDITFTTSSTLWSTSDISSHINNAAQLMTFKANDSVLIVSHYQRGLIRTRLK